MSARQTGHYLDKVHARHPVVGGYRTACNRQGVTTRRPEHVTCKRCLAKVNAAKDRDDRFLYLESVRLNTKPGDVPLSDEDRAELEALRSVCSFCGNPEHTPGTRVCLGCEDPAVAAEVVRKGGRA